MAARHITSTPDVSDPSHFANDTWRDDFAQLRREGGVHFHPDSANGPYWSITSHPLIKQVDANHTDFSSAAGGISIADRPAKSGEQLGTIQNFIAMDPPRHEQQRATVSSSTAPSNLANLEPLIRERVVDILDQLPVGETFDWVDRVSIELTCRMLATLFDFPYEDRRKLVYWSDMTTQVPQVTGDTSMDMAKRREALMDCATTFQALWQQRAAEPPKFDLISMLAHGAATKEMASNAPLFLGNILLLLVGGNDTTRNSISGGVLAMNEFPDQFQKLRQQPDLIPNAVAEIIRWQTPVIHMRRTANRDVQVGDSTIPAGAKVVMWYLSGNRDERVYDDPERLIIDRHNARSHLAFGFGIHRCMGNRLAEMQLRVLWEEIVQRFTLIEQVDEVTRVSNNLIRGIRSLPVRIHRV
jgi:cytochrome P450